MSKDSTAVKHAKSQQARRSRAKLLRKLKPAEQKEVRAHTRAPYGPLRGNLVSRDSVKRYSAAILLFFDWLRLVLRHDYAVMFLAAG